METARWISNIEVSESGPMILCFSNPAISFYPPILSTRSGAAGAIGCRFIVFAPDDGIDVP
jgi:hypothetical protein